MTKQAQHASTCLSKSVNFLGACPQARRLCKECHSFESIHVHVRTLTGGHVLDIRIPSKVQAVPQAPPFTKPRHQDHDFIGRVELRVDNFLTHGSFHHASVLLFCIELASLAVATIATWFTKWLFHAHALTITSAMTKLPPTTTTTTTHTHSHTHAHAHHFVHFSHLELLTPDGLTTRTRSCGNVARLCHKPFDNAVERAADVVQRLPGVGRLPLESCRGKQRDLFRVGLQVECTNQYRVICVYAAHSLTGTKNCGEKIDNQYVRVTTGGWTA